MKLSHKKAQKPQEGFCNLFITFVPFVSFVPLVAKA
jgi:hypothetical protein